MRINTASYQRILGDELRRVRKQRGWTRKQLQHHLDASISLQTLATYELGTRQCSVVRLAELCLALDVLPHDVLARVHERVFSDERPGHIRVNLASVAQDSQPELLPLRRWAADRLQQAGVGQSADVHLDLAALEQMAELCGIDTVELIGRLRKLTSGNGRAPG